MSKKLLVIGKKNSSKTVFITQFYIRLQKGKSKLSLIAIGGFNVNVFV